jgi:hypothetical protein
MRSVLLDTNLLLLFTVGFLDKNLIGKHKRTREFTEEDFDLLVNIVSEATTIWITAHCLAEASNLLKQTDQFMAGRLMKCFMEATSPFRESYITKEIIFAQAVFQRLGVADSGIVVKAKRVDCVLTVDFDLYKEISRKGYNVINFNHLRMQHMIS